MFNDFMKYTKYSEVTSLYTSIFIRNTIGRETFFPKFYFPNGILALKIASNNSLTKTISKRACQPYSQVPGRFQVTGMMIEGFFWGLRFSSDFLAQLNSLNIRACVFRLCSSANKASQISFGAGSKIRHGIFGD